MNEIQHLPSQLQHHISTTSYGSCIIDETQQQEDRNLKLQNHESSSSSLPSKFGGVAVSILVALSMLMMISVLAVTTTIFHPTLSSASMMSLSTIAMESSTTSSSSSNSLIDILEASSTIVHPQSYYSSKVNEFPSVSIDLERERQVYNGRTTKEHVSMTIAWTNGQFRTSEEDILNPQENEKSIIALLCGDSDSHLYYMDAKTLTDAVTTIKSTRRRRRILRQQWYYGAKDYFDWWGGSGTIREKNWHNNNDDTSSSSSSSSYEYSHDTNDSIWYIGSVPQYITDQRKCQAIIYYYIHEDEYVIISKSTIIHL